MQDAKRPSETEHKLLILLAQARGRTSGKDVARMYSDAEGRSIPSGTLYATFSRMRDRHWIDTLDISDDDGRVRYFKLSLDGERALQSANTRCKQLLDFGSIL